MSAPPSHLSSGEELASKPPPLRSSAEPWPAGLKTFWILVCGGVCLLWGSVLVARLTADPPLTDFVQEWTSARNFFTGRPIYLGLDESIPLYLGGEPRDFKINAHPPASVLVSLPLGILDYATAYRVWNVISLGLLALSLWLLIRPRGLNYSPWAVLPVTAFLITSNPLAQQINQGQLNLVLLALLTGAWAAQRQEAFGWSGALLGAAAAIKLFPAFLGLYFLMARQWRALAAMVFWFAALNGLTALVLGWESYAAFIHEVLPEVATFRDYWMNASFTGFWTRLFDPTSGHTVPFWQNATAAKVAVAVCSALVVLLTAWKTAQARTQAERDNAYAISVTAMLLVSPITWDHYFLLLIPPLLIFWKAAGNRFGRKAILLAVVVALGVIYSKWIWDYFIPGDGELARGPGLAPSVAQPIHAITVLAYPHYALLILFVLGLLPVRASGSDSQTDGSRSDSTT